MVVNILWPFVPLAIILHYAASSHPLLIFAVSYIGMIPAANLLGFAGQEFARKMPKVSGFVFSKHPLVLRLPIYRFLMKTGSSQEHIKVFYTKFL